MRNDATPSQDTRAEADAERGEQDRPAQAVAPCDNHNGIAECSERALRYARKHQTMNNRTVNRVNVLPEAGNTQAT
jgi:hypothetical protein